MLLFSAVLRIKETMTKEDFISIVIEWNQNNPREENVIKDISYNGESSIRFGDDKLWMEIIVYNKEEIVAVRYEKVTDDGVTWDTDYIMNFKDRKLAIQLDRSYREDSLVTNAIFSTPLFISHLIAHDYLEDDGDLKVDKKAINISGDNLELFAAAISGRANCQLPIVFVTKKKDNTDPVEVSLLASKLKGVAHVMVQEDRETNKDIRIICSEENEYNGAIGIYYPNQKLGHKRCIYRDVANMDKILMEKVIGFIFQFGNLQKMDTLYTWQGVSNAILNDGLAKQIEERLSAEKDKVAAQNEVSEVYAALDEELAELQQRVEELTKRNEALFAENQGLMAKLSHSTAKPVLFQGEEEDFYPGEIKDFILSSLSDCISNSETDSRKRHILEDIVFTNNYEHLSEEKRQQLKHILKGYKTVSSSMKQDLMDLGFDISEEGKHYKLLYKGDDRYTIALAKTPSDHRSGDNIIGTISRKVF